MALRSTVFALFVVLAGTALSAEVQEADVVGTWKFISVDGKAVSTPFYMKLSADGKAASWPAPKDWSTTVNGVSYGGWSLKDGYFVIDKGMGPDNPKSRIQVKKDEMTFITEDDVHLVYHRVVPDLEPGKISGK